MLLELDRRPLILDRALYRELAKAAIKRTVAELHPRAAAQAELKAAADAHYVCVRCAHTYAAPERPDRCERCRQHGSWLICTGRDLNRAEQLSE